MGCIRSKVPISGGNQSREFSRRNPFFEILQREGDWIRAEVLYPACGWHPPEEFLQVQWFRDHPGRFLPIVDTLSEAGVCYSPVQQCHSGAAWALDTLKVVNWLPPSELFNRKPRMVDQLVSSILRLPEQAGWAARNLCLEIKFWLPSSLYESQPFPSSHQRWTRFL